MSNRSNWVGSLLWKNKKCLIFLAMALFVLGGVESGEAAVLYRAPNTLKLIGHWGMEDGTGSSAIDSSGNGNTGTLTNMEEGDWSTGKRGTALDFDGAEWIAVSGSAAHVNNNQITISAWVFPRSAGTRGIVSKMNDSGVGQYALWQGSSNEIRFLLDIGTYKENATVANVLVNNEWQLVTGVYNGVTMDVYRNGTLIKSVAQTGNLDASTQILYIGSIANSSTYGFRGALDDVRIYNRALSAREIDGLYDAGSTKLNRTQANKLQSGLVGYWTMDGKQMSNGRLLDLSGNNNYGTPFSMGTTSFYTIGKSGQAITMYGGGEYVDAGAGTSLEPTKITASAWIKTTDTGTGTASSAILEKSRGAGNGSAYLVTVGGRVSANAGKVEFGMYDGGGWTTLYSTALVNDGLWHHIAVTYDLSTIQLYIDGVRDSSRAATLAIPYTGTNNFFIGKYNSAGDSLLDGSVDDVRIYNRALSAREVYDLYNVGVGTKLQASQSNKVPGGLVGYWSFDGRDLTSATSTARVGSVGGGTLLSSGISIGATSTAAWIGTTQTVYSWNHQVSDGNNRLLLVAPVERGGGNFVTSVTVNGVSLTKLESVEGTTMHSELWYLLNPVVASSTITVTLNAVPGSTAGGGAVSINNVHPTSPFGMVTSNSANSANPTTSISATTTTMASTSIIVTTAMHRNESGMTPDAAQELCLKTFCYRTNSGGATETAFGARAATTTGFYTTTWSGAVSHQWSMIAAEVRPMPGPRAAIGKSGQAVEFDGDDYIDYKNTTILDGASAFSVGAWVWVNADHDGALISKTLDQTDGWYLASNLATNNDFVFGVDTSTASMVTTTYSFGAGTPSGWNHIMGTYDGVTMSLYWNGEQKSTTSQTGTLQATSTALRFGDLGNARKPFVGKLDEVRLYNRALSAREVYELYNAAR